MQDLHRVLLPVPLITGPAEISAGIPGRAGQRPVSVWTKSAPSRYPSPRVVNRNVRRSPPDRTAGPGPNTSESNPAVLRYAGRRAVSRPKSATAEFITSLAGSAASRSAAGNFCRRPACAESESFPAPRRPAYAGGPALPGACAGIRSAFRAVERARWFASYGPPGAAGGTRPSSSARNGIRADSAGAHTAARPLRSLDFRMPPSPIPAVAPGPGLYGLPSVKPESTLTESL
ncbi:hypothetical protein T261_5293 [Streptomyces lydicus]|nr:hypothetical protein T261_5293 [Streptomyces lydicus]